jgi:hypothetical protein
MKSKRLQDSTGGLDMPETLHFAPNVPVTLSLVDPEGEYDADMRQGTYQTVTGQTFTLPRPAVILLNQLEPRPGEEIQIVKRWKGRPSDPIEWTICLTPRSEQVRACEEMARNEAETPSDLSAALEASISRVEATKPITAPPTLLKRPIKRQTEPQPRLFDKGTGTDGPAPAAAPIPALALSPTGRIKPVPIPWNVAFREVSAWVAKELKSNDLQWSDESQKSMCCTVLIAECKAGRIGPWERGE